MLNARAVYYGKSWIRLSTIIATTVWSRNSFHPHFIHEEIKIILDYMLMFPIQETQLQTQDFKLAISERFNSCC